MIIIFDVCFSNIRWMAIAELKAADFVTDLIIFRCAFIDTKSKSGCPCSDSFNLTVRKYQHANNERMVYVYTIK